jgi:hypothetical protein
MKTNLVTTIALLGLLILGLTASFGCDALGIGTEVHLEGVTMSMDGKIISGLPSQKADVIFKASTSQINISTSGQDTVIKLSPADATIVIGPNGVSITGVDSTKIQIKWQETQ